MSKSPFISTADRNTIAVASDTTTALLELSRLASDVYEGAKAAQNLLQLAAQSEKPKDRDKAYRACRSTQLAAQAVSELAADIDNDAGTLRVISHNLAYNHD